MHDMRMLVVEDDPYSQDVASTILAHYGIAVDVVSTAEEGLNKLAQVAYTAAIIDLSLPEMDGWGLLQQIRANPQLAELPCFAVTAYYSGVVAQEAIQQGFRAFFPKPLDAESFVQDLTRHL